MLKYIALGALQGITEFLPISSSAHLVILSNLFNIKEVLTYVIIFHLGTILALIVFLFKDILRILSLIHI
ncbi:MAG: undecaprenyl-diphosphate phosphatase, partial [Candidatus Omnitrophica bacterium]|nr:undecaprenyl-diphosphate phosphatase [Candidatus Omnitrophota bacterium]